MAGSPVCRRWSTLPYVHLDMGGGPSSVRPQNVDVEDFAQEFNWSINEDHQEFVIRITRKPEAVHAVNVAMKIEGGLSKQPDGSVVFDGSVGNGDAGGDGVSTFGLTFKISQEVGEPKVVEKTEKWLSKAANAEPNPQQAQTNQPHPDPNSHQTLTNQAWANNANSWQQPLDNGALLLLEMERRRVINMGLLSQAGGERTLALVGSNNQPGHGTLCSLQLGCNPCLCFKCRGSRQQYGDYHCFCADCCDSMVRAL